MQVINGPLPFPAKIVSKKGGDMPVDIRKPLKKFLPYLLEAQQNNLSEADTMQRIVKMLEQVFGYDVFSEITREQQVKEKYCDLAIKIDGKIEFLVEAKAAGLVLRDRHIEQAERYASEGNIRWVLLTNGTAWNLYHLTFDEGIEYEKVFEVDLSKDDIDASAVLLALLQRQCIKAGAHEEYWEKRKALSPKSISKALFHEDVLRFVRRLIRKTEGITIDEEDLANSIHDMLSTEARELIGPLKIYRKRKQKTIKLEESTPPADVPETQSQPGETKP